MIRTARSNMETDRNRIESPHEIRPGKTRNLEGHIIRFSCALRTSENYGSEIKLLVQIADGGTSVYCVLEVTESRSTNGGLGEAKWLCVGYARPLSL